MFDYSINKKGKKIIVKLVGSVRSDESLDKFSDIVEELTLDLPDRGDIVLLDFEEIKLINSSGIGKMLVLNKTLMENDCKLYLYKLSPELKQLFKFARIELPCIDSEDEL